MTSRPLTAALALFACHACASLPIERPMSPFDTLDPAADAPVVFFPGSVSDPETQQWDIALSPSGDRIYIGTANPRRIIVQDWTGTGWTAPYTFAGMPPADHGTPFADPSGRYLYFSAEGAAGRRDLFRLDLEAPDTPAQQITDTPAYGEIRLALDAAGNGFLWTDRRTDGEAQMGFYAVSLKGDALAITGDASDLHPNDPSGENSPYVDPEGRVLIFSNYGLGDGGEEDLYLSQLRNGVPLPPVPMGEVVNTPTSESSAILSPDGKFLLYVSGNPDRSDDSQVWAIPTASVPVLNAALTADRATAD